MRRKTLRFHPYLLLKSQKVAHKEAINSCIHSPSVDLLKNPSFFEIYSEFVPRSRAKRGLIIPFLSKKLESSRMFWQECLVGTLIDLRRFSVETMQRLISISWRLRDSISVVGRDGSKYIVHFNNPDDHRFMLFNGPWSIDCALLIFELWEPNRPFSSHYIFNTPLYCIQFCRS